MYFSSLITAADDVTKMATSLTSPLSNQVQLVMLELLWDEPQVNVNLLVLLVWEIELPVTNWSK